MPGRSARLVAAAAGALPSFEKRAEELQLEEAHVGAAESLSLTSLAARLQAAGKMADAVEALRIAAVVDPAAAAPHNELGVLLTRHGDPVGAAAAYGQAVSLAPSDARIRTNLAVALLAVSAQELAAEQLRQAILLDPGMSVARLLLCLSLLETGRVGDAHEVYEQAIRDDPALRPLLSAQTRAFSRAGRVGRGKILADILERLRLERIGRGLPPPLAPLSIAEADDSPVEERAWAGVSTTLDRPTGASNGRLGFTLHSAELLNHYRHIWRRMEPGTFELLAGADSAIENTRIAAFGGALGYPVRFVEDVLAEGLPYEMLVSNHLGSAGLDASGVPVLIAMSRRHLRVLYALGKARWNFGDWNEMYDAILCWGPYQASALAHLDHPRLAQVGYPRLDPLFWPVEDQATAVKALGGDPSRPTIAWLPTWAELSSIDAWAAPIGDLQADFNVIVKVHPLTRSSDPARMRRLADAGLTSVADPLLDNVRLLRAADVVLADYGNSAFGAMYADRDLVLLNVEGAEDHPLTGADSIDLAIRKWLFSVSPSEPELLPAYLADRALRQDQRSVRDRLRRAIFAPYEGVASDMAALAVAAAFGRLPVPTSLPVTVPGPDGAMCPVVPPAGLASAAAPAPVALSAPTAAPAGASDVPAGESAA